MERKDVPFELKDMSMDKRTAVISHAVYNNIDRVEDISRKGMFSKSWQESKSDIAYYKNHDDDQVPGKVMDVWEDESKAYTQVYHGTHTLGNDTLIMLDEGIIRKSSFGYIVVRKEFTTVNGKKVRELKEVKHIETSVLTRMQANPLAGIESVTKASDIANVVTELKQSLRVMEKFCRNTKASDPTILLILGEIKEANRIIAAYDTAFTQVAPAPDASKEVNDREVFRKHLLLFNQHLAIN